MHCSLQTVVPELMMEGRGLAERPRETPPTSPGVAVPSPLQSSCKVCSCPGMEMDFAVLGGLQEKKKQHITYQSGADYKSTELQFLTCHIKIRFILLSAGKLSHCGNRGQRAQL